MAVGRISGPLLARNLFRDNVPLAFYNINSTEEPILYLDVSNTRVGIRKDTPLFPLDVKGTINGDILRIVQTNNDAGTGIGTIGKIFISTNTISSVTGPVNIAPAGGDDINLFADTTVYGSLHATGNISADGNIELGNVPTDKLRVLAEVDSDIIPAIDRRYNLGGPGANWAEAYVNTLVSNVLTNTSGNIEINPAAGLLEINGQIRVNSPNKPLGTAPIVTNILYVTMDGGDTNDGSAMDETRACRTISGATKSPLYGPGTSIKVAPGRFYENNPIEMQPYTSIIGSDLRTTFVEPLNKTQDLFHVRSGCYIAQMQMSNGRSGLLPIENANGYNRGAYATAFPPYGDNGEKIDIFQSPYIQNCTNQSGPWLKDGTMFIPNQTVQIPKGVAIGSWPAGAKSITVSMTTGTISVGNNINSGPQNLGFFDARTLILANKRFMQDQVINFITHQIVNSTSTSYWYDFTYSRAKCFRDVGIILENLSYDMTFGGNEKSVESGLAYYQGVISLIAGQERQTIEAINYINSLTQRVIINSSATIYGSAPNPQVFNRNLKGGSIAGPAFARNIGIVTNIILNSPAVAPPIYKSSGPDQQTISAETLLQDNRAFIQNEVTAWTDYNYSNINYSTAKCKRDLGIIIDSIGIDLTYPNNTFKSQSTFAGLQYWNQSSYTGQIPNEITTTTNAIKYVNLLAQEIIQNITTGVRYQGVATQTTRSTKPGSYVEANFIKSEFTTILDIIINGTTGVTDRVVPNSATTSSSVSVWNAYNLLVANRSYIQTEAIAFIEQNKTTGFAYDTALCERDVGFMIDSVCFDLLHGGNRMAIQSGVTYYTFDGSDSAIKNEIPQTLYAYNTLTNIVSNIVQNIPVVRTQTTVAQDLSLPAATATEASALASYINNIINIITNGPSAAPAKRPVPLTASGNPLTFNAWAILQANKEFIEEEVVSRINQKYFRQYAYNEAKCFRDTGLIVDAVVQDLMFSTSSQSTFSGLQYWNQNNVYTGQIAGQVSTTTNAILFAKELAGKVVMLNTSVPRFSTGTQIINMPMATQGQVAAIYEKFDTIVDIITNGVVGVNDKIVPNRLEPSFNNDDVDAFNLLQANKTYIQQEVVQWVEYWKTTNDPGYTYNQEKCFRDVGCIIDSVSFDLLYSGNRQSIQSGVYYYGYNASDSAIYGQTTGTIAAFNRIRSIIPNIIRGIPVERYQSDVLQVFDMNTNDTSTIATAVGKVDVITNIIENGPGVADAPAPINRTRSTSTSVINAGFILSANREFIQAETTAYVNQFYAFKYNREKCSRDAGLIIDAVSQDLILGGTTKSIEAGVTYWKGARSYIEGQIPQTVASVEHAKEVALTVIRNLTYAPTSGNGTKQRINTYFQGGGFASEGIIRSFDIITKIMRDGPGAAPQQYVGSGLFSATGVSNNDTKYAPRVTAISAFTYDETLCRRDGGYIIDGAYYDAVLGTNYNAILNGLAYQRGTASVELLRSTELSQTITGFTYLKDQASVLMANNATAAARADISFAELLRIIDGNTVSVITFTNPTGGIAGKIEAKDQLVKNKEFLQAETVAWITDQIKYNIAPFSSNFVYNKTKCYRDVGFIVDALCYDILYGGNSATRFNATAYLTNAGASVISGETSQSVAAFNHMSEVAQSVIQNINVIPTIGNQIGQRADGEVATATEATRLSTLVDIITGVITDGNLSNLPAKDDPGTNWVPAGIVSAAGAFSSEKADLINRMITYINSFPAGQYLIELDSPTVGPAVNATLYFGDTLVFPKLDAEFTPQQAVDWGQRMVDPTGSMGGSLVDGAVVSDRSPINSFVYDAFTQVNQGGRGIHIINNGYAQLVSVFTIFCSTSVEVGNGGIASITNSNANFGDFCLVAKGKGKLDFQGTVYNPPYPTLAQTGGQTVNGQYYPNGYWPQNAEMLAFIPDATYRPHIGLVMEVVPPKYYLQDTTGAGNFVEALYTNDQGLPGFLTAAPNMATLTTGSIKITDIVTEGIVIGQTVYIRDQFGNFTDTSGVMYATTGTIVTDVNYQSITLSLALTSGGGEVDNPNFFTILTCGNAYYNVLSSSITPNPIPVGESMLPDVPGALHKLAEKEALEFMTQLVINVVANSTIIAGNTDGVIQNKTNDSGAAANSFVSDRFNDLLTIVNDGVNSAPAIRKTGQSPPQASQAIAQLRANKDFIVAEVTYYAVSRNTYTMTVSQTYKCKRDTALIIDRLILDLTNGGNYNAVMSGLSYWSRAGTYHKISLEDQVRNPALFPDGSTINFYQRSYMSALGYTFEYVGAGTNYGSLPQVGRADPNQSREVVQLDNGKVFFTSTDQNGDFRIGPGLVISQATGVLSGRTFTKSLFAQMTPFILAVEAGG